ncbi:hypothetical protein M440DRAFT_1419471 [Trichoderma longibrachiatum ATCC 18648]|uniref:C2H2-type domain-containing protein n=1 Tax=Trichoderma longibrachiatum ATCC 18648 TaxID=983965 RepID=A0A2T4CBU9_TRILO|nr:hypothetical protein M440DRAFT_1419471 [Trichoderma longibrachiatum ATCC 18648]
MAQGLWPDHEGVPPGLNLPQQERVDRQMIRHLLGKYSREELGRLLQEEGRLSPSSYEERSFMLSSSNTSTRSSHDDSSNAFDSTASSNAFSDTSSTCGSVASNLSPRASNNRKRNASPSATRASTAVTDESSWDAEDTTPTTAAPKQKGSFTCGFCLEEGIQKTCTRKNDLKRHMEDFHHTNAQWFCRHRGCQMVFDWQTAYKAHLKNAHGGSRMNLDDAKIPLCPQTVFACGFENCLQVFEAPSDAHAGPTFKEYVSHVVKHFDEGASSGQWSYSARMRNLLRQSSVQATWSQSLWPDADASRLRWNSQTSSVLRKRLETRHLGDMQFLVQYAIALGSSPNGAIQNFRADFVTPIRSECRLAIHGHTRAAVPPATPTPEPDHMLQYGMSTGGPNPAMVAYYQRHAYMPQPAQPQIPSPSYTFQNAPPSPGYDAHQQALQQQQQQEQQQQQPQPQPQYMGMSDTPMVGSDYVPHANSNLQPMPGAYATNGMQSPAPTDICGAASLGSNLEQRTNTYAYNSSPYAY